MRCAFIILACAVFTVFTTRAGTISDPFHQPQTGCNYNSGPTFSNCDVIGDEMKFDIQGANVQITADSLSVTMFFNYGGGISLSQFNDGVTLQVGDIFFYDPSAPLTSSYDPNNPYPQYRYGIPLTNHNGLLAGDLYQISDPNSLQTANSLINDPNYYYRTTQPVWMPAGETLAGRGDGVTVVNNGNGITQALYAASIQVPAPSGLLDLISNGEIGIAFASATCGNDILSGAVQVGNTAKTPEPQSFGMLGIGIMLIGAGIWRRKH